MKNSILGNPLGVSLHFQSTSSLVYQKLRKCSHYSISTVPPENFEKLSKATGFQNVS